MRQRRGVSYLCNHKPGVTNSQTELDKVFSIECNLPEECALHTLKFVNTEN